MEIRNKTFHFLGDSITEGYGLSDINFSYWKLLEKNDQASVKGYGIGGTRFAIQRIPTPEPSADQNFPSRLESMDSNADAVVVLGGTNDFGHGDAPFGQMNDRTAETFYGALHVTCLSLIKKYPEAQLVFMTPLHRADENMIINSYGYRCAARLIDYVDAILEVAGYYSIPVLDLYRISGIQPAVPVLRAKYAPDGLHPNENGHMLIYRKLRNFLALL